MSEYRYESFEDHFWPVTFSLRNISKNGIDATTYNGRSELERSSRENADENFVSFFFEHQFNQVKQALDGGYFDDRYLELYNTLGEALDAYVSRNEHWKIISCIKLGEAIGRMSNPIQTEIHKELIELKKLSLQREMPLLLENAIRSDVKKISCDIAKSLWANDSAKELRTTDMAHLVIDDLNKKLTGKKIWETDKYKPDILTMKKWIREVAPEYAKKGGRPPKIEN